MLLTVSEAAALLGRGEVVAFGTETVYGLGADATSPAAVAKVFAAKERPSFDPLIVHVAAADEVGRVCARWTPRQRATTGPRSRWRPASTR